MAATRHGWVSRVHVLAVFTREVKMPGALRWETTQRLQPVPAFQILSVYRLKAFRDQVFLARAVGSLLLLLRFGEGPPFWALTPRVFTRRGRAWISRSS